MKKLDYGFLECVKKMPPLRHSQPDVVQKIFNIAQHNRVIRYDPGTGKWQGVDYSGN